MAAGERHHRRKTPSFSSSLLDAIYHSIDDPQSPSPLRRNPSSHVDDEIQSLRRAIMVEKWMHNHTPATKSRHFPTNSSDSNSNSNSSCIFTSSETDSSSATPKKPDRFNRFNRTKSTKKPNQPVSPGARIANFLNSIFSSRNAKKDHHHHHHQSVRKSRSMKDAIASSSSSAMSRSCLMAANRNASKSKRSVRFNPVLDSGGVGSRFIKKNMESILVYENERRYSDASSDLFELENIGAYDEELPVYGTTDVKINRAIASGFVV
ncbi:protein BIG GRAIN 1-like A [Salvia hispanica]|uniref:protein BIG GRAIN 1-like A n=1 Tax=Salvia hispanica TaxID=49212 RepID=UPI002009466A|nr:protein BIG GRAIN 1-like A [Salvia hispanica]